VKNGHNLLITAVINKELGKKIRELKERSPTRNLCPAINQKVDAINEALSYLWSCLVNHLALYQL
jgi:hypothetical protein